MPNKLGVLVESKQVDLDTLTFYITSVGYQFLNDNFTLVLSSKDVSLLRELRTFARAESIPVELVDNETAMLKLVTALVHVKPPHETVLTKLVHWTKRQTPLKLFTLIQE